MPVFKSVPIEKVMAMENSMYYTIRKEKRIVEIKIFLTVVKSSYKIHIENFLCGFFRIRHLFAAQQICCVAIFAL